MGVVVLVIGVIALRVMVLGGLVVLAEGWFSYRVIVPRVVVPGVVVLSAFWFMLTKSKDDKKQLHYFYLVSFLAFVCWISLRSSQLIAKLFSRLLEFKVPISSHHPPMARVIGDLTSSVSRLSG